MSPTFRTPQQRDRRFARVRHLTQAIFVGSGIFKSDEPERMAKAIVEATTHYLDANIVAKVSTGLGHAMKGMETASLEQRLAERGW